MNFQRRVAFQFTNLLSTKHRNPTCRVACCCMLGFVCYLLLVIYGLCFAFVNKLKPVNEAQIYFVLLCVGNLKTVLKGGYSGRRGVSSFVSLWFVRWLERAYKCAYDCGLLLTV